MHSICHQNNYIFADLFFQNFKNMDLKTNDIKLFNYIKNQNKDGLTVLHLICFKGNVEIFELVVKYLDNFDQFNTVLNITTKDDYNCLHMAAKGDQTNMFVILYFKYNFKLNTLDKFNSNVLHHATYNGGEATVALILSLIDNDNNTIINVRDTQGYTPLHLSVIAERSRIAEKLIKKGADLTIKDNKGRTALDIAEELNRANVKTLLNNVNPSITTLFFKQPLLTKHEKSYFNVILFILLHLIFESLVFIFLIPAINKNSLAVLYSLMLLWLAGHYMFLLKSNPGYKNKEYNSLIDLVEDKQKVEEYCSICIVNSYYI